MKENTKAEFNLLNYKINNFWFKNPNEDVSNVTIDFNPSGIYIENEGKFFLNLVLSVFYKSADEEVKFVDINLEGVFEFSERPIFEKLPDYFYVNSVAIVFPYIRAFATILTATANVKPLILPVMNLISLQEDLKANTVKK